RISNDAILFDMAVDQVALSPAFTSSELNYSVEVPNEAASRDIFLTKGYPNQILTVTGAEYQTVTGSVYTYRASDLTVGANPIQILVTAEDGTTTNLYLLSINRLSNNADLSGLSLSSVTL